MTLKFGTDGIRGVAVHELTPELAVALGRSAAEVLCRNAGSMFIGRDTRVSGPLLQGALTAGLASSGVRVIDLGVVPTPLVAHASARAGVPGAVISASHNPFQDNGIKFFQSGGGKLTDDSESQIEARLAFYSAQPKYDPSAIGEIGEISTDARPLLEYSEHLAQAIGRSESSGLHVVLDCSNGAASTVAPQVYASLGVRVTAINDRPDGRNINRDAGSTHPDGLRKAVVEGGADLGIAFDGDADRLLAVDHAGNLVDGDELLAMLAIDLRERQLLAGNTLVVTVMSNLGLHISMRKHGIDVHETKVGDRYVLEALNANDWSLGGEQSGHIIFRRLATTGDGLLTGLQLLSLVQRSGVPLQQLAASAMTRLPQILRNLRVDRPGDATAHPVVTSAVDAARDRLGDSGRVLLRASGTEPLVRVMVEAPSQGEAAEICDELCRAVQAAG